MSIRNFNYLCLLFLLCFGAKGLAAQTDHNLRVTVAGLVAPNDIKVKFTLISKTQGVNSIKAFSSIPKGDSVFNIQYKSRDYYGTSEILLDKIGSIHLIFNQKFEFDNVKIPLEAVKSQTVPALPYKEQQAYAHFCEGMNQLNTSILKIDHLAYKPETLTEFCQQYYGARKEMNKVLYEIKAKFYDTYADKVLGNMLLLPETAQNINLKWMQENYFGKWNYKDPNMLNNKVLAEQLLVYRKYFLVDEQNDMRKGIDAMLWPPRSKGAHALVYDFINEKALAHLIETPNGALDKYIKYLYENYAILDNCNGTQSDSVLMTRIKSITNCQVGNILPIIAGPNQQGKIIKTSEALAAKPYTLVVIWGGFCKHCIETMPQVVEFARANISKLMVYAFSVDKEQSVWEQALNNRPKTANWFDVSDLKGLTSEALKGIYIKGTPSYFLLNKQGEILSRSTNIQELAPLLK